MATELDRRAALDLRGRTITTFIVHELHEALAACELGEQVELVTDAFTAIETDVRSWCRVTGHELVAADTTRDPWRFTIARGQGRRTARRYAAIIQDDGLLELLGPLGFALAAALEGHDVALYFQGPAVRVLGRGYTARLHGLGRPFSRLPRTGLERAGHIAPQAKVHQLQGLGARIYACGPSMQHFKVPEDGLAFEGVVVAEYLTFMEQLDRADVQMCW